MNEALAGMTFWEAFGQAIILGGLGAIGTILMLNFLFGFKTSSEKAEERYSARHANDEMQTVPGEFIKLGRIKGESIHMHPIDGIPKEISDEAMSSGAANGYRNKYWLSPQEAEAEYYLSKEYEEKHPGKSGAWVFRGGEPNPRESDAVDLPTPEQWDAAVKASRTGNKAQRDRWWEWDYENMRYANFGADRPNPETPEPDEGGPVDFDWLKNWREGK